MASSEAAAGSGGDKGASDATPVLRVVHMSDTHQYDLSTVRLPAAFDVLVHTGDFTNRGRCVGHPVSACTACACVYVCKCAQSAVIAVRLVNSFRPRSWVCVRAGRLCVSVSDPRPPLTPVCVSPEEFAAFDEFLATVPCAHKVGCVAPSWLC
jgi:hypothetical protein